MKKGFTRIAVVLDRSGSMSAVREATIDGFNEFVNGQRQAPGEASLLLTQFDHEYETVFDKPLADVPKLDSKTYVPRGSTALHDAIGRTINELGKQLETAPEGERPEHVVLVILTDGHENASHEFTRDKIAEMVTHQREKYQWNFIFLGANQDAVLTARGFNIPQATAMSYEAERGSITATFAATTSNLRAMRVTGQSASLGYSSVQRRMAKKEDHESSRKR